MKILVALAVTGFVCTTGADGQIPKADRRPNPVVASTRFQLSASVEHTSSKVGDPIFVKLVLKNVSAGRVSFSVSDAVSDYQFVVTDALGKEPPRTEEGRMFFDGAFGRMHVQLGALDPGEKHEAEADITTLYQLTQPGTYYVVALRMVPRDPSEAPPKTNIASVKEGDKQILEKAVSDRVHFTITP